MRKRFYTVSGQDAGVNQNSGVAEVAGLPNSTVKRAGSYPHSVRMEIGIRREMLSTCDSPAPWINALEGRPS